MAIDGKPAINTPRTAPRELVTAVGNIRERIEKLEGALAAVAAQAGQSSYVLSKSSASISNLQSQINQIVSELNLLALSISFSAVGVFVAGETLAAGKVVYPLDNTTVGAADPLDPLKISAIIGVTTEAANAGSNISVRQFGVMEIDGAIFDVGRTVYVDIGGGLTQTPTYGGVTLPVGIATSATAIFVRPDWPALYATLFDPAYDDFMPITKRYFDDNLPAPAPGGGGVYPFLTDENDEDILTESGYRIRIED